jgi:hypothetical protein
VNRNEGFTLPARHWKQEQIEMSAAPSNLSPHSLATRRPAGAGQAREQRGLGLRVRVLLARTRLDRSLAEGADPSESPEIALRAVQIISGRHRRMLAAGLDRILAEADGRSPRRSSAIQPIARDVRAARAALIELSFALREDAAVEPAGVALTQRLMTDGAGPLYVSSRDDALWHAVRDAREALLRRP